MTTISSALFFLTTVVWPAVVLPSEVPNEAEVLNETGTICVVRTALPSFRPGSQRGESFMTRMTSDERISWGERIISSVDGSMLPSVPYDELYQYGAADTRLYRFGRVAYLLHEPLPERLDIAAEEGRHLLDIVIHFVRLPVF